MTFGRRALAAAIGVACLLATAPSCALGATAKIAFGTASSLCRAGQQCSFAEVQFDAIAGETNVVTVVPLADPPGSPAGGVLIRDEGAPITPGPRCTGIDSSTVSCHVSPQDQTDLSGISIDTGDGNDSVVMSVVFDVHSSGKVRGGPGNDRLVGGRGDDFLFGESGADTMIGGDGNDTLEASDGSGAASEDVIDGGVGTDTVSYAESRKAVSVAIGATANEDRLTSIESLVGGRGNDILVGDAGDNRLDGGPGNDRLRGNAGADALDRTGGPGADRQYGGAGNDELNADGADRLDGETGDDKLFLDGGKTKAKCGRGLDSLIDTSRRNRVPLDCERVELLNLVTNGPPTRVGRIVRVRCELPSDFDPAVSDVSRISLFKRGRLLGRSRPVRRKGTIAVRLNRIGRRLARVGSTLVLRETPEGNAYSVRIR